jgi:transketolase
VTGMYSLARPDVPVGWGVLDPRAVGTVRVLAANAVQKVGNCHPGTAGSLASPAYPDSSR